MAITEPAAVAGNTAVPQLRSIEATPRSALDAVVGDGAAWRGAWRWLGIPARIDLLDRLFAQTVAVAGVCSVGRVPGQQASERLAHGHSNEVFGRLTYLRGGTEPGEGARHSLARD